MDYRELPTRTQPRIDAAAFVASSADVVGDVTLGPGVSVWYGCVLRGDVAPIRIGTNTNIQDLTVVHVDEDCPAVVGDRVGIGHRAIIHGCEIEDDSLIGMGAIILSGAVIGRGSLVAAGAVITEGMKVPPKSLVVGVPGKVVREVDGELRKRIDQTVEHYLVLGEGHRERRWTRSLSNP